VFAFRQKETPQNRVYDFSDPHGQVYDVDGLTLNTGEPIRIAQMGGYVVIEVKVDESFGDKLTINQNYLNATKLIQDNGFNTVLQKLEYRAYMDAVDGSLTKAMTFVIKKDVIDEVYSGNVDWLSDLPSRVEDLWIHPQLLS
jgi:hypothetical protein